MTAGKCDSCGYNLAGVSPRKPCPECGHSAKLKLRDLYEPRKRKHRMPTEFEQRIETALIYVGVIFAILSLALGARLLIKLIFDALLYLFGY